MGLPSLLEDIRDRACEQVMENFPITSVQNEKPFTERELQYFVERLLRDEYGRLLDTITEPNLDAAKEILLLRQKIEMLEANLCDQGAERARLEKVQHNELELKIENGRQKKEIHRLSKENKQLRKKDFKR